MRSTSLDSTGYVLIGSLGFLAAAFFKGVGPFRLASRGLIYARATGYALTDGFAAAKDRILDRWDEYVDKATQER